jgi:hypothetical protein
MNDFGKIRLSFMLNTEQADTLTFAEISAAEFPAPLQHLYFSAETDPYIVSMNVFSEIFHKVGDFISQ